MFEIPNWPSSSPTWADSKCLDVLLESSTMLESPETNLDQVIELSEKFPIKFPINTARCKTLITSSVKREILDRNIKSAYPLIHESVLNLYAKFILHKRKFGTRIEKELYKKMSVVDLVDRLLKKRAVMFLGKYDQHILMDKSKGSGKWDTIGKEKEKPPLILKNCISYDEIKLSVFLSVSSYSYFINDGMRKNKGVVAKNRSDLESEGIVIGIIGARLRRPGCMECEEVVISKLQNTPQNGYGSTSDASIHGVFAAFYQEPAFLYSEATASDSRFASLPNQELFDNVVYAKRLALSFDTLLVEANHRAGLIKKTAYIHVVGIGLGVWKISDHQKQIFVDCFFKRLSFLGSKLNNVSDVHFAYFGGGITGQYYKDNSIFPIKEHIKNGIKIRVSNREPYTKIESGKLLVVSYAWDGNALPGNEYWKGLLGSTGDSSTASSCQVAELHNPHINPMVSAANLMVVTPDGHVPILQYIDRIKERSRPEEDDGEEKEEDEDEEKEEDDEGEESS